MASSSDLERFYSREVEFPSHLLTYYINIAEQEVRTLLQEIRKQRQPKIDPTISFDIIPTGSSYEGLKVKGEMELDFMIALSHDDFDFISTRDESTPCSHRKIKVVPRQCHLQAKTCTSVKEDHTFENDFTDSGYLMPSYIYHWFQSIVDRAMNERPSKYNTKFVGYFPARTLIITVSPGTVIHVDLVPAIKIHEDIYVVAKPLKGSPEIHNWRLSFSLFEKNILKSLPPSSCHLKTLKILKYLREHEAETSQFASGICSYHLKTAFLHLHASTKPTQWQHTRENLRDRLYELINLLIRCMEQQQLDHFFIGNPASRTMAARLPQEIYSSKPFNLFDAQFIAAETLNQAKERLVKIRDSLPAII